MKRSEFKSQLQQFLDSKLLYEHADDELVEQLLMMLEKAGMHLCVQKDLRGIGTLWTPEGWEQENE